MELLTLGVPDIAQQLVHTRRIVETLAALRGWPRPRGGQARTLRRMGAFPPCRT